jgi:hypothetical protein
MTPDTPRTISAMSLKQNYDLSEKDCPVYENYVHAEVCAELERELAASQAEVERLKSDKAHLITYCANLLEAANLLESNGITRICKDWGKHHQ